MTSGRGQSNLKAAEAMIAWNKCGGCEVGPLLRGGDDWTRPYRYTAGAAFTQTRKLVGDAALAMLFIEFHTMVVRDGVSPQDAHRAFLKIEEYRRAIAPDISGAE